jgi:gluconokinase
MGNSIVIMGVAGCGKSSLGAALASSMGLPLIEGDDFHSQDSREKMSRGVALTDADRSEWLREMGDQLRDHPNGVVLTCSALKRAYRQQLRDACLDVRFVFMDIARDAALQRVASRASSHFFSASLVDSQFATLESPIGERKVLRVDALETIEGLLRRIGAWLRERETT